MTCPPRLLPHLDALGLDARQPVKVTDLESGSVILEQEVLPASDRPESKAIVRRVAVPFWSRLRG
jgi:hypothetical protein